MNCGFSSLKKKRTPVLYTPKVHSTPANLDKEIL